MNLIYSIIFILIFSSCVRNNLYHEEDVISNLLVTSELNIQVPEDSIAIVKFHDDTLAVCTHTQIIEVPIVEAVTKSDDPITIEYINKKGNNTLTDKYQIYEVIAFEDTKKGDYDYNDLIIHVLIKRSKETVIQIQPIAMGAMKNFKLGITYKNKNGESIDEIICNDCRNDLFKGHIGYINVSNSSLKRFDEYLVKTIPWAKSLDWFIEVEGERLYAISKNYNCLNSDRRPYGLIFNNIRHKGFKIEGGSDNCGYDWWLYPEEGVCIDYIYDFDKVISGKAPFYTFSKPKSDRYVDCIKANNKNIITKENEPNCLYSSYFKL